MKDAEFDRFAKALQQWMADEGYSTKLGYMMVMVGTDWLEKAADDPVNTGEPTVGLATNLPSVIGMALMTKVMTQYARDDVRVVDEVPPTNGGGRFDA